MRTAAGLIVARTIDGETPDAARRIAVLLVSRAIEARVGTRTPPLPAPRRPEDEQRLMIAPQAFLGWWEAPGLAPQLGLLVGASYGTETFGAGVVVAAAGGLCCARRTKDVDGDSVDLHAVLEGRVRALDLGGPALHLHAGFGVSGYLATVRPVFPDSPSPGTPQDVSDLQVILLAAASLRAPLSPRTAFVLRASLRLSVVGRRVLLPEQYDTGRAAGPGSGGTLAVGGGGVGSFSLKVRGTPGDR